MCILLSSKNFIVYKSVKVCVNIKIGFGQSW